MTAKIATLVDNFSVNDLSTNWPNSFGTVNWSTGEVAVKCDTSHDSALANNGPYDLTSSSFYMKFAPYVATSSQFSVQFIEPSNGGNKLHFGPNGSNFTFYKTVSGTQTELATTPYNSTSMAWWRCRESGGTVYIDTAPDNSGSPGTWTNQFSAADTTFPMPLTSLEVQMLGGDYGSDPAGYAYIYAVNSSVYNPTPMPTGPAGEWTLAFEDEFNGTEVDTTRWALLVGNEINGTSCLATPSCSTVANGYLYLTVASATEGAYISSSPSDGAGVNGWDLPVGGCVEAKIYSPGPNNTDPYNWGGIFCSGQDWPNNGEIDFWEVNSSGPSINYHWEGSGGEQQSGPYNPSGNWANSWHVTTIVRNSNTVEYWWDGTLIKTWNTDDEGGAMSILPLNGAGNTSAYGIANATLIDYVRGWVPA